MNTKPLRLDRYLATVTDYSRSDAKKLIKAGDVSVDGVVVRDPRQLVSASAELCVKGFALREMAPRYFMLNKPQGCVSATKDRQHLTVLDLLDEDNPEKLHIAGRLDIDTTGLVIITDDGPWSHALTSPHRKCWKTYRVTTAEPIALETAAHFKRGVLLKGEKKPTSPAELEVVSEHCGCLQISEGRYHQVKRMFAEQGNLVTALHRESIGDIILDVSLELGEYRPLTEMEIASIKQ
ncbi:MAG: pseudouridine synthase [Spongiibacteraceae bacterium]